MNLSQNSLFSGRGGVRMLSTYAATLIAVAGSLAAQPAGMMNNTNPQLACDSGLRGGDRFCEVREQTFAGTGRFSVEGLHNGSLTVHGWNRNEVLVRARVSTEADDFDEASDLAAEVRTDMDAGRLRVRGPSNNSSGGWWIFGFSQRQWNVSVEVFVPHQSDLDLSTHNGPITISDVQGRLRFSSHNGRLELTRVAGNLEGSTHNGGISIELAGNSFDGQTVQASTHNGRIRLGMPADYAAHVRMETHNGSLDSDFPVTVSGRLNRSSRSEMEFDVGQGGSPIRMTTHNGGIELDRL